MKMKKFIYWGDDNEQEDDEIKALVDMGADLIEIDDNLADKKYALDKIFNLFLPIYHSCKGLWGVYCV